MAMRSGILRDVWYKTKRELENGSEIAKREMVQSNKHSPNVVVVNMIVVKNTIVG